MAKKASSEYIVKKALLSAEREFAVVDPIVSPIDILQMIGEVSVFESIEKAYLTAQIVVVDTQEVISEMVNLNGTERLEITISTNENVGKQEEFTLYLRVISILEESRPNDYTVAYAINCVSEYAYNDAHAKISKSYTGNLEDIAEKVLKDYLNVQVDRDPAYWDGESVQGRVKVIVPYLSPLETTNWLIERGCLEDTSPMFMWATVWDDDKESPKVRLGEFGTMATWGIEDAISDAAGTLETYKRTFIYSRQPINRKEPTFENSKATMVEFTTSAQPAEDTLRLIQEGAVGSRMATLDTYTTAKFDRHFDLSKHIATYQDEIMVDELFGTVLDEQDKATISGEKKPLTEFDARFTNTITSYGTYEWENGYHDVSNQVDMLNKLRKGVIKTLLYRETLDVTLSGYNFMFEKLSAGDVIRLKFPRTFTDDDGAPKLNSKDSGSYMILALRRIFIGNTHRVVATVGKLQRDLYS